MLASSIVCSSLTLFLHLHFYFIHHLGHFKIVKKLLEEYYYGNKQLSIYSMPFNIGHNQSIAKWSSDVTKLIAGFPQFGHVVVFITTHSDPDTGDLWIGQDKNNTDCFSKVSQVNIYLFIFSFYANIDHKLNSG